MIKQNSGPPYEEGWEAVGVSDLNIGDEIILECRHYEYKTGYPIESTYYRTIVGEHRTVSGMMKHIANEPTYEFPNIAPWNGRWIYAGNSATEQMWRRKA